MLPASTAPTQRCSSQFSTARELHRSLNCGEYQSHHHASFSTQKAENTNRLAVDQDGGHLHDAYCGDRKQVCASWLPLRLFLSAQFGQRWLPTFTSPITLLQCCSSAIHSSAQTPCQDRRSLHLTVAVALQLKSEMTRETSGCG